MRDDRPRVEAITRRDAVVRGRALAVDERGALVVETPERAHDDRELRRGGAPSAVRPPGCLRSWTARYRPRMSFPKRLLVPGEELVLDLRPHWIALFLPTLATIGVVIVGFWLISKFDGVVNWVVLAAMAILLISYPLRRVIWWLTSYFVVTSDRLIHREGWIAKHSMEIPLEAINDVRFKQTVFERIIGAGTLVVQSASESGREEFRAIRNPEDVQKTIYHQGEMNQQRMFRPAGTMAAPPPPTGVPMAPSTVTELERLADLRAKGVLTEDEFQAQKARILGQA